MRVLVVGKGPVAQVLATSMAGGHRVGFAVRERTGDTLLAGSRRLRTAGPAAGRAAKRRPDDHRLPGTGLDVVISTASPASPEVAELLARPSAAIIAAVTQVPSEVELLRELAGDRPWGLVVLEFFAAGADPAVAGGSRRGPGSRSPVPHRRRCGPCSPARGGRRTHRSRLRWCPRRPRCPSWPDWRPWTSTSRPLAGRRRRSPPRQPRPGPRSRPDSAARSRARSARMPARAGTHRAPPARAV